MNKRISFSEYDAERILEWRFAMKQGLGKSCCEQCEGIQKRLEALVGKKEVRWLKRQVKRYPYFK